MFWGFLLIGVGIACYIVNVILLKHYLDKNAPGLLEIDANLPASRRGEEYLWEKTAGTGVVPKWVSLIGLLAIPLFLIGIIMLIVSFFM